MTISPSARTVWRNYVTDGVPSSGNHPVKKSECRNWGTAVEVRLDAVSTAAKLYATRSSLYADLTEDANTLAWVYGDSTAAYNGIYMKVGASGSGSWTRIGDLPYSFVKMSDTGAGTPNAIQLTSSIPTSDSVLRISNVFEANTGNVTISENGGTAKALLTVSGEQIASGGLTAGMMITYVDDGVSYRLTSDQASAAIQEAAEDAAAAAAASASAAAASAAGVSLPAVAANRMLVDNAAGTARESKTFSQVNDLLEKATWAFDNNTLYKSRSNKDRWLDSVIVADLLDYDPSGITANGHTVLQSAINIALAAGKSEVILPRGILRFAASASIVNPISGGKAIKIRGQGDDVSLLQSDTANINILEIGPRGSTLTGSSQTGKVCIDGVGFVLGVASTAGSAIDIRNTNEFIMQDCDLGGFPSCLGIGLGASDVNDTINVFLINTGGQSHASGNAAIRLGSGGVLHISGGRRWNGNSVSPFIKHSDTNYNWDGLYCIGTIGEGWTGYIVSSGKGVVNAEWTGGQVDRAGVAFEASAATGGSDRNWNIQTQILQGPSGSPAQFGCVFGSGGGNSEGHKVRNCHFQGLSNNAVYVVNGAAVIANNMIQSCGHSGAALIRMASGTGGCITGNYSYKGDADGSYGSATNGILFEGPANGWRVQTGNKFLGISGAEISGTA
ncbi:hypothetical protein NBH19_25410 [Rhizobium sp. S95]|uniref:Uncharacterized protein n=1 Tax=Ciceribacter sichuanensis TaxID=2949647 RepID=A0AAJ1F7B0_9HYPH|nr:MULTISPECIES: hypothetical protein [unclassified Ciceribacter]MCM2399428.1 hypothetical protein [Ciceribacter sp. S95]MCO5959780.1 hypothetical protein [Ciceribacter sp. S101]